MLASSGRAKEYVKAREGREIGYWERKVEGSLIEYEQVASTVVDLSPTLVRDSFPHICIN